MVIPGDQGRSSVAQTRRRSGVEQQYQDGLITSGEKYNKVVDAWSKLFDHGRRGDDEGISASEGDAAENGGRPEPVWMMAHSGARGSATQMRQLAGMRGLMAKPSGEIIETPIIVELQGRPDRAGVLQLHPRRPQGLADTALKTANSGYLTRRLVDVAQDCIITEDDCGTERASRYGAVVGGGEVIDRSPSAHARPRRSTTSEVDPLIRQGDLQAERADRRGTAVDLIEGRGIDRSHPLGADLQTRSALRPCYGATWPAARRSTSARRSASSPPVDRRAGHPAHHAHLPHRRRRAAGRAVEHRGEPDGTMVAQPQRRGQQPTAWPVVMGRNTELVIDRRRARAREVHRVPYGRPPAGRQRVAGRKGQKLAEWDPRTPCRIITEKGARRFYVDLVEGVSMREVIDDRTISSNRVGRRLGGRPPRPASAIIAMDAEAATRSRWRTAARRRYPLSVDWSSSVENGQEVPPATSWRVSRARAARPRHHRRSAARRRALFEARRPEGPGAIICEIAGRVEFGKDYKNKRRIPSSGRPVRGAEPVEYLIPKGAASPCRKAISWEKRRPPLIDGNPVPHDIPARARHREAGRVSGQRDPGGLPTAGREDQRQAHRDDRPPDAAEGREITDAGDSTFLIGEQVDKQEFDQRERQALA